MWSHGEPRKEEKQILVTIQYPCQRDYLGEGLQVAGQQATVGLLIHFLWLTQCLSNLKIVARDLT